MKRKHDRRYPEQEHWEHQQQLQQFRKWHQSLNGLMTNEVFPTQFYEPGTLKAARIVKWCGGWGGGRRKVSTTHDPAPWLHITWVELLLGAGTISSITQIPEQLWWGNPMTLHQDLGPPLQHFGYSGSRELPRGAHDGARTTHHTGGSTTLNHPTSLLDCIISATEQGRHHCANLPNY